MPLTHSRSLTKLKLDSTRHARCATSPPRPNSMRSSDVEAWPSSLSISTPTCAPGPRAQILWRTYRGALTVGKPPAQESCTTNAMFRGASKNSGVVDGSYATCGRPGYALNQALAGGGAPCSVVSVGLNDDTSFEEALHLAAPSCCFRGYDGSLKGVVHGKNRSALAVRLPQFLRFNDNHFTARNWEEHRGTSISLFKIDCEGCEISILNPVLWLRQQICIEQILVEVHRGRSGKGKDPCAHSPFTNGHVSYQDQVMKVHKLLTAFDEAQLDVFWRARGGGPGGCILFGAVRRTPCP